MYITVPILDRSLLIIILGLHQMEVFHFNFLKSKDNGFSGQNKHKDELLSAFLLRLGFSFGWTPCIRVQF